MCVHCFIVLVRNTLELSGQYRRGDIYNVWKERPIYLSRQTILTAGEGTTIVLTIAKGGGEEREIRFYWDYWLFRTPTF